MSPVALMIIQLTAIILLSGLGAFLGARLGDYFARKRK